MGLAHVDVMGVNLEDDKLEPNVAPPVGFSWRFASGVWAIFPEMLTLAGNIGCPANNAKAVEDVTNIDTKSDDQDSQSAVHELPLDVDSDDSMTEFENSLCKLLSGLKDNNPDQGADQPKGAR